MMQLEWHSFALIFSLGNILFACRPSFPESLARTSSSAQIPGPWPFAPGCVPSPSPAHALLVFNHNPFVCHTLGHTHFFGAQSSFLHMIYSQMFFPSKCRHTSFITPLLLINTRRKYINFTLNDFQQHKAKKSGKTGPPQTPVTRNPIESRQVGSLCLLYDRVYHSR